MIKPTNTAANSTKDNSSTRRQTYLAILAFSLVIPLIMTLLGSGVDGDGLHWTLSDFVIFGILISGTTLMIELVRKLVQSNNQRIILVVAIIFTALWLWAELAVGIFTTWGS